MKDGSITHFFVVFFKMLSFKTRHNLLERLLVKRVLLDSKDVNL